MLGIDRVRDFYDPSNHIGSTEEFLSKIQYGGFGLFYGSNRRFNR